MSGALGVAVSWGTMRPLLLSFLLLCALAPLARGEGLPLPVDDELEVKKVSLNLRDGRVEILIDPSASPRLVVEDLARGDATEGFVTVDRQKDLLTITQPHGDETVAPRLFVKITAAPGFNLTVNGESLEVTVEGRADPPEPSKADSALFDEAAIAPAAAQLRIAAEDSDVRLTGVTGASLAGRGTRYTIEECSGPVLAELDGTRLSVSRHRGLVRFKGEDGDVEVEELDGALRFQLEGGTLQVSGGKGSIQGEGESSTLLVEAWQGTVQLSGISSRVEVRRSGNDSALVNLRSERSDLVVEDLPGGLSAELIAGSLAARRLTGRARVNAKDGAQVELEGIKDTVDLTLDQATVATVKQVVRTLKVKAEQSSLAAEGFEELEARLVGGSLTASGARGKVDVKATDAEIDLDLSGARGFNPSLTLDGRSSGRLVMPSPCTVWVTEGEEPGAAPPAITASGCELTARGTNRQQMARQAVRAGTTYVDAKVTDTARLAVSASGP